jgi:hypothetical protein
VVWALEHKDQWRENASGLFLEKTWVPDDVVQLNGRDIPFVIKVTYLGVTFDRRMTWRHHMDRTVAKALRIYGRSYSVFQNGRLSKNIKLSFIKLWLVQLWLLPVHPWSMLWNFASWNCSACRLVYSALLEILTSHTSTRIARGFQNSLRVWLYN